MGIEIERKFLVDESQLPPLAHGVYIAQGYVETVDHTAVRARVKGDKGFLTLKGKTEGMSRLEYEYEIPLADARAIIQQLCAGKSIEKTRYEIQVGKHVWEIDVFAGENAGLIVAEVELASDKEEIIIPAWASQEVTDQARFYNMNLIKHPYTQWTCFNQGNSSVN